jgi:hypothetical protein
MEILRFEQVPESAPKRKKSSRGFLALGLVAALFGISTAFASSTITVNSDLGVQLGQGVTAVTACDQNIGITMNTDLSTDISGFHLSSITFGTGTATATTKISTDCAGKMFKITLYDDEATPAVIPSCSGTIVKGEEIYYSGEGGDASKSKCYLNSIYVKLLDSLTAVASFDITWSYVKGTYAFNLQDHPVGHIAVETTSYVPPTW